MCNPFAPMVIENEYNLTKVRKKSCCVRFFQHPLNKTVVPLILEINEAVVDTFVRFKYSSTSSKKEQVLERKK